MKKFLLAGVALSAFIAGPAMAADLPVRGPVYKGPPPVVTYFSWTGCYVGGHVGGLWVQKDWTGAAIRLRPEHRQPRRQRLARWCAGRL